MMSQLGQQAITINILTNISRGTGNWPMKVGQLIVSNQAVISISPKNQEKKVILRTKKSFQNKIKSIFHHFHQGFLLKQIKKVFWQVRVLL